MVRTIRDEVAIVALLDQAREGLKNVRDFGDGQFAEDLGRQFVAVERTLRWVLGEDDSPISGTAIHTADAVFEELRLAETIRDDIGPEDPFIRGAYWTLRWLRSGPEAAQFLEHPLAI